MLHFEQQHYTDTRDHVLPSFDTQEWKHVQTSSELRFFKQIRGGRTLDQLASEESLADVQQAVANGYSTMMCDGQIQGSMEDVMYGMTASSQEDLMTNYSYKNAPKDCVWLGTAEGSTSIDPYHSVDFIWVLRKLATYAVDTCFLKATGIEIDQYGKRYGYLVLHSVELPQCRPFDARGVSRMKMYFTCLFREPLNGGLNVIVRGIFNMGKNPGKIAKTLVSASIKSFMMGFLNAPGIGLAKKLTFLARRNYDALQRPKQSACSSCFKTKKWMLFGLNTHLFQCGVCGLTVCSQCIAHTKQILFLGLDAPRSKRSCCATCLRDARRSSRVLIGDQGFQVIADYYLQQRFRSFGQVQSSASATVQFPLYPMYSNDTMTREYESSRCRYREKSGLSADMPTNSTANESLDTDPFSRELDEVDFCFSDDGSRESTEAQPDLTVLSDSEESSLTLWHGTHRLHVDDFIPAKVRPCSEIELLQRLCMLNAKAEHTYWQTQATSRQLRSAELD